MINRDFCTGFLVSMSITALVFIIINGLTGFSSSENTNPHSSSMFVESKQTNINKNNPLTLRSRSIFVMGDSSVDCGDNTLFYPVLRHNLSLFPCSNGSKSTLIHHFLGILLSFFSGLILIYFFWK